MYPFKRKKISYDAAGSYMSKSDTFVNKWVKRLNENSRRSEQRVLNLDENLGKAILNVF